MLLVVGVLSAWTASSQAADPDEARKTVERAIQALGGEEKLARHKAMTWKANGVFHAFGAALPYTCNYFFQVPDDIRFEMTFEMGGQKIELVVTSNGEKGWEKGMVQVREMAKEKFAEFKHETYLFWVLTLVPLRDPAFALSALGESKFNDRAVVGVKVSRKDHRDVLLYFDKETGLMAKCETRVFDEFSGKEVVQESAVSDYKDLDGIKCFLKLTIKRAGNLFLQEELSEQKRHEKLDAALFGKP
jgi:hypothetical protein